MERQQFMAELKQLLGDLPAEERDDALNYYEDYFNEAGPDNEQSLIMQLESPQKVAKNIKSGLAYADDENGEFSETGFSGFYSKEKDEILNTMPDENNRGFGKNLGDKNSNLLLIIIVCVFASPLIFSVFGAVFGGLIGILGALFGIIAAVYGIGIGCTIGGLASFIFSFTLFAKDFMGALIVNGAGLLLTGIGLGVLMLATKLLTKVIPAMARLIKKAATKLVGLVKKLIPNRRYV
mgnify:CR=1 FL=1